MHTVSTGWRTVTPGRCLNCGSDDEWTVDGRGSILCACQGCPDCGLVDAYGFHESGCPQLARCPTCGSQLDTDDTDYCQACAADWSLVATSQEPEP